MSLEDKVIQLSKEEFFVKLFDYDNDFTMSNQFSTLSRFYEVKNIKIDYFIQFKQENKVYFYITPRLKNKIGFKYHMEANKDE